MNRPASRGAPPREPLQRQRSPPTCSTKRTGDTQSNQSQGTIEHILGVGTNHRGPPTPDDVRLDPCSHLDPGARARRGHTVYDYMTDRVEPCLARECRPCECPRSRVGVCGVDTDTVEFMAVGGEFVAVG
eukprot:2907580-Pyramimonas_sp.AAC.1